MLNEAAEIERQLRLLRTQLDALSPGSWAPPVAICVADNGSTDGTADIARSLMTELAPLRVIQITERGKGFGVRAAWSTSSAEIVAYTDLDFSAGIDQLPSLIAALDTADFVVGSRYMPGARRVRSFARVLSRSLPSRVYRIIMRLALPVPVRDVNCGFKAARASAIAPVLPTVRSGGWFFDTELVVLASVAGCRVVEVPVTWVDDPESRVHVGRTANELLRGVVELRRRLKHRAH